MSIFILIMAVAFLALYPMAFGGGLLPTCRIKKGKKEFIINLSDLPKWEADGYERYTPVDAPSPAPAEAEEEEEGNYSLIDAVRSVRRKAALEEIVEANEIEVEGFGDMTFKDQKAAVLEILEDED